LFSSYAHIHLSGPRGHLDLDMPLWARIAGTVLAALDTGGLHWFFASQIWYYSKKRSGGQPKA